MTVVRGMEGPATLEEHPQSRDPREASTADTGHCSGMYPWGVAMQFESPGQP